MGRKEGLEKRVRRRRAEETETRKKKGKRVTKRVSS